MLTRSPVQRSLFQQGVEGPPGWRPNPFPIFGDEDPHLFVDVEATGLRWWDKDLPVGIAVTRPSGASYYLPFAHRGGGNHDEGRAKEWARQQLRGRKLYFFNGPYDINMIYKWGIDLEAQGCTVGDIGALPALLNDKRRRTNLDLVGQENLGIGKLETPFKPDAIADMHASQVEEYAQRDTILLHGLYEKLMPEIQRQNLRRVLQLEDDVLFPVCEMVRNGVQLNEELLDQWIVESTAMLQDCLWQFVKELGFQVDPNSRKDMKRLYEHLGLPLPTSDKKGEEGKVSFTKDTIAPDAAKHPLIANLRKARSLSSLQSKYLFRYKRELEMWGCLRYSLHPLRIDDDGGTISGRFSCSAFKDGTGVNIQQVGGKKHAKSLEDIDHNIAHFLVRKLYLPQKGYKWGTADADQIEFRLFAHYAESPAILKAYAEDPHTDFHNIVMAMLAQTKKDITRPLTKDINFANIYGAMLKKLSEMTGLPVEVVKPFYNAYHRKFPEVKKLLADAQETAEERGYVMTLLGRRARFETEEDKLFAYRALNRIIQGGAADEMKIKIRELHRERKRTGFVLRFTVHDEVDGDIPDFKSYQLIKEVLNRQILTTKVPLFWSVEAGSNWQDTKTFETPEEWAA